MLKIYQRQHLALFNRIYRYNGYDCLHDEDGERYIIVKINKEHKL